MYLGRVGQLDDDEWWSAAEPVAVDVSGEPAFWESWFAPDDTVAINLDSAPTAGSAPSMLDKLFDVGQKAVTAWLTFDQQRDFNALNVERAKKGLPPLATQQYLAQTAPQVRAGLTADTQKTLLYGVGVAAAAALGFALIGRSARSAKR